MLIVDASRHLRFDEDGDSTADAASRAHARARQDESTR